MPDARQVLLAGLTSLCLPLPALAEDPLSPTSARSTRKSAEKVFPAKRAYSPYAGRNFPTRPLFGDTHLHTMFSFDAGAFGARLVPSDAYRFAKGEEIMASSGQPAKLSRPLDFLVVADHSDNMGFFPDLLAGKPEILADPDRPPLVRHDPGGSRRRRSDRNDRCLLARHFPEGAAFPSRNSRLSQRLAGDHQSSRRGQRSGPVSRPSLAMNGRQTPAATICIATLSSATMATRPVEVEPFITMTPLGSDNPRDLWKWMAGL